MTHQKTNSRTVLTIGLAQMEVEPAGIQKNLGNILNYIECAESDQLDLLIFPEMAVPGYLLGDMWERNAFLKEAERATESIVRASKNTVVAFGTVVTDWNKKGEDGRPRKYNAVILTQNGRAFSHPKLKVPFFIKTLMPNYREFDDSRHFYDMRKVAQEKGYTVDSLTCPVTVPTKKGEVQIGITLCEDGWSEDYADKPFHILAQKGVQLILNLSCSPYTLGKRGKRNRLFTNQALFCRCPIAYVNNVGLQNNGKTVFTFDGDSALYKSNGDILLEGQAFAPNIYKADIPLSGLQKIKKPSGQPNTSLRPSGKDHLKTKYAEISEALLYGAKTFLDSCGLQKVVIGLSGGIDSAIAAALYGRILQPEQLLLVNMPSQFNSRKTISLARTMADNLGCYYAELSIEASVRQTQQQLQDFSISSADGAIKTSLPLGSFHLENIQARDRGARLLAAIAAQFGGVFSCNANKAEMTVGYSTLYGDLCGFLAIIGDLWKEEVFELGRYLNAYVYKKEAIPEGCFKIPPSAELSANQDINKGQGDPLVYAYHDKLFYSWMQKWQRDTPEESLAAFLSGKLASRIGCPPHLIKDLFPTPKVFVSDLERWWNLYNGVGVAKRVQAPPVLAVSSRAYGFDHREFIGRPFYSEEYYRLKKSVID